jgi:hypothetical protein
MTTYTTNPGFRETQPIGPTTSSSFDLTDAAPTAVEGDIVLKGVIAQHQLRFADARVLVAAVESPTHHIPAGTVLARVTTDEKNLPVVWCDLRPKIGGQQDCLADSAGSGRFDQILIGYSSSYFLGFGRGGVSQPQTLPAPAAYRTASVAERPTALLGYQWCDGDGVSGPPRFAYAVNMPGDDRWMSGGALGCAFGGWPDPQDHQHVDLDGHRLTVTVDAKTGHMRYRFEGRIPPVEGLKPLVAGAPLAPPTLSAAIGAAVQQAAPDKPLVADGRPPAVVSGALASGQPFFTVGVRHGVTGVLIVEAQDHATFSEHRLPVGTPVYGMPMAGSSAAAIVWCAPQQAGSSGGQPGRWTTYCMPAGDRAFMWTQAKPAMMPLDLSWGGWTGKMNSAPTVERRPVALPPMVLSYAFGGWNKDRWLVVLVQLDWGEGPQTLHAISVPPSADGSARLKVMGGEVIIHPAPQSSASTPAALRNADSAGRAVVEIVVPPKPGAEIAY